jgi:acetylornithine deacetylase/succinyl-diaminopimelate desuccinylase-like protein
MDTFEQFQQLLMPYIGFKSVSTDKAFLPEIQKTVEWLTSLFEDNGFDVIIASEGKTNPVVIATYRWHNDSETVLVYGHYDVQPADFSDGWNNEPFELTNKDGKLYGRGVVDNKGQHLIHMVTAFELIKQGKLGCNVIFMIEGNEETSNPDIAALVKTYKEILRCDSIIISDGEIVGDTPTVEASLKGGFNARVAITGAPNDLHSGLYGGAAPNPALMAAHVISQLKSTDGHVNIPCFYDGVNDITHEQQVNLDRMPSDDEVCDAINVIGLVCEPGVSFYGQVGLRPTIEITGIGTGYTGEGFKNIIPSTAEFRVNFRLVEGQDAQTILYKFKTYLFDLLELLCVTHQVSAQGLYRPVSMNVSTPYAMNVRAILQEAYGKEALIKYVGGGIPVVDDFQTIFGIDPLLVPLGNEDCNMHGANENFTIDLVKKGLAFSWKYFSK